MCKINLSKNPRVLIAIATYNEIENLPEITKVIHDLVPYADLLVIDDNSPDGTGRWAEQKSREAPRLHVVVRKNQRGLGSAVICAFQYAIDNKYDYLVNLDADFSHPPSKIPELLEKAEEEPARPDVVIGSRYIPGGATPDWSFKRRLMSRCVNLFAKITLGLSAQDTSGAFRCYRVDKLKELNFSEFRSSGYSFFEEALYRLKQRKATFAELPIIFLDRKRGKSKINFKEALNALLIMAKLGSNRLVKR